ncbi:serine hydrolase domain-containing protein [Desulfonatronovibrio magnus]|uniref:serine hydrolase domain-containing protein n=1 Tax=Desulfonatronovibrio magnus TaxID=698827 RepID=UPI0005EB51B1|nr:serine hydrolase domain-containing protein [Desulfonatronovibrio magnus]
MLRQRCIAFLALCLTFFVLLPGTGLKAADKEASSEYANAVTAARETIWKAITSGMGSGATVAIMDHGEIVYSEGIGVADRATNRPVDANTRFNIGSTSKMFAAVAILMLVDEGRIVLDEPVKTYLPEFTMQDERYRDITVRMLFNHSSGLPGSSFYFGYEPDHGMHQVMLQILGLSHLKHDPGVMSIYCNDGFTLAEMIVERVSGLGYLEFLTQRIFIPLSMVNTGASIGESGGVNVAEYFATETGVKYPREVFPVYGAGGLSSTAEDLCRFGDSLTPQGPGRILSDSSLEMLLSSQPTAFSDKLRGRQMMNAFGWDYSELPGYLEKGFQVLAKTGGTGFYSTNLQVIPQERLVVALSISGRASVEALTRPVLDGLMLDKGLMEKISEETPTKPVLPEPIPDYILDYEGYYTGGDLVQISFDRDDELLLIIPQPDGMSYPGLAGPTMPFTYNNGSFFNFDANLEVYFTTVEDNDYIVISGEYPYEFDRLMYQKLKPAEQPRQLKEDLHNKVWLVRNAPAYINDVYVFPARSLMHPELPGYLDFNGIKQVDGDFSARMAATAFRDQSGFLFTEYQESLWSLHQNFLFSLADDFKGIQISSIPFGNLAASVRIGRDGFNEWLRIEDDLVLRFQKPDEGRVIVTSLTDMLYDSVVDTGSVYVPNGSYVFFAGSPDDRFRVYVE